MTLQDPHWDGGSRTFAKNITLQNWLKFFRWGDWNHPGTEGQVALHCSNFWPHKRPVACPCVFFSVHNIPALAGNCDFCLWCGRPNLHVARSQSCPKNTFPALGRAANLFWRWRVVWWNKSAHTWWCLLFLNYFLFYSFQTIFWFIQKKFKQFDTSHLELQLRQVSQKQGLHGCQRMCLLHCLICICAAIQLCQSFCKTKMCFAPPEDQKSFW